ncbi:PrgI family protein [Desulfogranum japonicum]|uniref:PrgI family protein n=1 Tax=Desulfogranum japonicum TaxID=231447 RepID=UPI00048D8320|nr:PrgI family protein [Desulfogranum japonicum]
MAKQALPTGNSEEPNKAHWFLLLGIIVSVGSYFYTPVPTGYMMASFIFGIIAFPLTVWHWKKPNGIKFVLIIMMVVLSHQILSNIYIKKTNNVVTLEFWLPMIIYFGAYFSSFFMFIIVFQKKLNNLFKTEQSLPGDG